MNKNPAKKINVVIVGIGRWGKKLLAEFHAHANVLYCVHAGGKGNASWVRTHYPHISIVTSYEEILKDPMINAVVIATPIETHFDMTNKALLAGKHVFVEKPLAKNKNEARALVSLASKRKLVLFTGYVFLYHDIFRKLQKKLSTERIIAMYSTWEKYGTFNEDIYWNLLPHDLAITIALAGSIKKLTPAFKKGYISKNDVVLLHGTTKTNVHCVFYINRHSLTTNKTVLITTKEHHYLWEKDTLWETPVSDPGKKGVVHRASQTSLKNEIVEFIAQTKNTKRSRPYGDVSTSVTATVEKLLA
ncbi:MAG: hypothetical protein A2675_01425 [Candidatus Yonathbacteria bacterium RIFCSPHIGHO2_01_FULL_51_10]|uniref:Gfo/Idh/MocA-like oxidoreductase N-terminal domain-containing protein n=1 Tax=Candidatus Yonathbacteria bacterium RIFCSPHIGHO2_01_FULL_51_10 TaxID=1802723 RepID=A0A1G2S458_9BACT|nr:MAG: hypothetical protein A2675_01425 [Candidatus Yonathbacteria bacterium RIFCSPHIGHO2_01_FULL_51_10]